MAERKADEGAKRKRNLRIGAGVAAFAALILIVWLIDDGGGDAEGPTTQPEIVTIEELEDAAIERSEPVYWAGPQDDAELELSQPDAERSYVRYLTAGAEAGDQRADFLTVGTYLHSDPVGALRRQGKESGGVLAEAPGGAVVYFSRNQPRSVYMAYPGVDVQIEVYDPSFQRALQLVNSGQIVPAG